MSTVCCFGEALIDFHGSASGAAPTFTAHAGGAPANVAVAIARLGGRATFVGMFGRDVFGDLLLRELTVAGVDTSHARRTDAANTALAFVTHAANGERSFSFYRPPQPTCCSATPISTRQSSPSTASSMQARAA